MLVLLFSAALLPSYLLTEPLNFNTTKCGTNWLITFVVIICFSAFFNLITLNILNRVGSFKQMDSYQEVAYNISNSNRGYIFLISAAKAIFFAVTAAFAINYNANYLTELVVIAMGKYTSAGATYGIYAGFVVLVSGALFIPYWLMRDDHKNFYPKMVPFGFVFAACALLNFVIIFLSLLSASGHVLAGSFNDSIMEK